MKAVQKGTIDTYIRRVTYFLGLVAICSLILDYGFYTSEKTNFVLLVLDEVIAALFVISILTRFFLSSRKLQYIKESPVEFLLLAIFILSIVIEEIFAVEEPHYLITRSTSHNFIKLYFVLIQVYIVTNAIVTITKSRDRWLYVSLKPARIIVFSYFLVTFLGSCLLKLPRATFEGISWIDAFFTSVSAVCVTGLTTLNVADKFTVEGQAIILFLIQVGGLGIITITSIITLFLHRGLRLKDELIVQQILEDNNLNSLTSILKAIIFITLLFELVGAIGLYLALDPMQLSEFNRLFTAAFHSISAYCNAGFSNLPDGFQSSTISSSTLILVIVMILIIAGGIGFYTITDLFGMKTNLLARKKGLSLQTKIIVYSSLGLIIVGAIFIWLLEMPQWSNLPAKQQILNALFTSVTSRTAGFSIVDIHAMIIPALLFVIFLMYIGGAPNSTSGGIKITTAITLMASFWAFVRGKDRVEIGWNTINMLIIRRAFIVFVLSILLLFISLLLLTITESFSFFDLFFETVSAFGTVGLSRGITPDLSLWGKIIIIIVMFLGRIGLFTVAIALGEEISQVKYQYPETTLIVG